MKKVVGWGRDYLDAMILILNTAVFLILGIISTWTIGIIFSGTIYDVLNAIVLISTPALINLIGIRILTGRKRSAIIPLLIIVGHCVVCLIILFVNMLFSVLLGLNILAVIFCIKMRPIIPRFKTRNGWYPPLLMGLLIINPVIVYYGTSEMLIILPGVTNPNFKISFYCEFYNNNTFTAQHLEVLHNHNARIFLAINESQIYNDSLALNLTKWFNYVNVEVYAWLLLNQSKGYWAADTNVLDVEELVNNFTNWAQSNNLTYEGILIDSEPTFQRMHSLQGQLNNLNLFGALANLRKNAKSTVHNFAKVKYEEIVANIQKSGYEAMVVGFPLPLDDLADNDDTLQRIMGVSTIPPYNWNYSSFMIYRSTYKELSTIDFGSYMVYSYARSIRKFFGGNSSISLSRSGSEPYDSIDELIQDSLIVKNIGFNEVIWISFERLEQAFGLTGLIQLFEGVETARSVTFRYNPWCSYSRLLFTTIDRIGIL
ncbi:MAG: hypothetical protein ACTSRC_11560 [Candidatus Helarchaeota archaeon]